MTECRSCGAEIRWALTDTGRTMPIDPEPVENGNLFISSQRGNVLQVSVILAEDVIVGPRYVSHFATCPDADSFRRKR